MNQFYDTPVLHIRNSIIAGNTNTTGTTPDCSDGLGSGTIESLGHNLIGDLSGCTLTGDTGSNHIGQAPILGALEDNGGSTQTHALLEGSPAIDAGDAATCEATDQRGVTRPQGAACDIGAFESGFVVQPLATPEADLALTASDSPDPVTVGEDLIYALTITNNGPDTASSLTLVQTLPSGVTFVSANPSQGGCIETGGEVTCDSATLDVDESMQVAIRVHVEPGTQGTLASSAQVSAAQSDADSTNNTVEITTATMQPLKPGAPRLLEPANGSPTRNTTPTLTWMAVTYATSYQVQIDDDSRFRSPAEDRVVSDPAYLVVTTLADGRYYWRVRASNSLSVLGSWSGARNFVVDTLPPPVPVLTGPKDGATATTARPKFTWKASSGANRYWLQVDDEDTFSDPRWIDQEINRTAYTSTLSLPQGTYFYRVMAGDTAGNWSEFGAPFTFRVGIQNRPAETIFTNDTTPSFQWYRYTDATAYRLELAADVDFTLPAAPFPVDTTARTTGYTLPKANALPYGIYYWRVSVDTGTGFVTSPFYRMLVISPTFPKAPTLINPANSALTADNQPVLEWGATVSTDGAPFTYQLQIDDDSRFRNPEQDTTTANLTYLAAPLADGRYYWRVRTVNYLGAPGGWSRARTFTVDTTPPVITQLTSPVADATVTTARPALRWKATGSPVSFDVQVGKDNPPTTPLLTVKTSAYTPVSPLSATTYFWRVRARDAAGNVSEWSSISPFTIISPGNATPPLNFAGSDDPVLSWTPISWALGYEVQVASRSNFSQPEYASNTLGPEVRSVTVDVPLPNGTYYWRVRARRSATSWGKWSNTGIFQVER